MLGLGSRLSRVVQVASLPCPMRACALCIRRIPAAPCTPYTHSHALVPPASTLAAAPAPGPSIESTGLGLANCLELKKGYYNLHWEVSRHPHPAGAGAHAELHYLE